MPNRVRRLLLGVALLLTGCAEPSGLSGLVGNGAWFSAAAPAAGPPVSRLPEAGACTSTVLTTSLGPQSATDPALPTCRGPARGNFLDIPGT